MAKTLNDVALLNIVRKAVEGKVVSDNQAYQHFLEDLGSLVADHFGGERTEVMYNQNIRSWTCSFEINDSVPDDGGVYAEFDQTVEWCNGEEVQPEMSNVPGM